MERNGKWENGKMEMERNGKWENGKMEKMGKWENGAEWGISSRRVHLYPKDKHSPIATVQHKEPLYVTKTIIYIFYLQT